MNEVEAKRRYREALSFYADEDNYTATPDTDKSAIESDGGQKARDTVSEVAEATDV
jgi:hypothetical protein